MEATDGGRLEEDKPEMDTPQPVFLASHLSLQMEVGEVRTRAIMGTRFCYR
jgi:hypothetical protein